MHLKTLILSCIVVGEESGVFPSISISKRKGAYEDIKNYSSEFLQPGKKEVN